MKVAIIDYGAGNVQSVKFAFNRMGIEPLLTSDQSEISSADKVIFPGVGEASSAMEQIRKHNLEVFIPQLKQPVLGICLGMQLMCGVSEERNTTALGIFPDTVKRFVPPSNEIKVPHMGWNKIGDLKSSLFDNCNSGEYAYFVHSYCVPVNEFTIATTNYINEFSAAIQRANFYATQFHPEKSGTLGAKILENFLKL